MPGGVARKRGGGGHIFPSNQDGGQTEESGMEDVMLRSKAEFAPSSVVGAAPATAVGGAMGGALECRTTSVAAVTLK